jgi:hypothetical protein
MVTVLAIGPKVRGFKPGQDRWIFKDDGRELKPSAPCRKILWHVQDPLRYDRDTDRQNSAAISIPVSPRFATRCLCCNQSRELWWMNRELSELMWVVQSVRKW